MFTYRTALSVLLSTAALTGCDSKKESTPPTPPTTPAAPTTPTVSVPAVPATPAPVTTVTPPPTLTSPATLDPSAPAKPAAPATPSAPDTSAAQADAKATLSQFQTDLAAKNWDACQTDLKKLKGMKDELPSSMKDAIDKAQASFTAAKTANSLIPGLGTPTPDSNK